MRPQAHCPNFLTLSKAHLIEMRLIPTFVMIPIANYHERGSTSLLEHLTTSFP